MKRAIIVVVIGLVSLLVLWRGIPWLANGGWPASGPVGGALPENIRGVLPEDGDTETEISGFCVYLDYDAGKALDRDSQRAMQLFLDGKNVTNHLYDPVELEYRTSTGQICYKRHEMLGSGWHTAKVAYENSAGEPFAYVWRFQVVTDQ